MKIWIEIPDDVAESTIEDINENMIKIKDIILNKLTELAYKLDIDTHCEGYGDWNSK